jgi:nucleotide-binding universal stress UspA family protein
MILMNAVLVATDFGETSAAAIVYGRNLARAFGARLHVLHVAEEIAPTAGEEPFPGDLDALQTDVLERATHRVDALLTDDDLTMLRATPAVRAGSNVADTIIAYAKGTHVDTIIVGTHGRGPVSHLFMGSVAEHVVRNAPCPVIVVRTNERELVVPDPVHVHSRV